MLFPASGICLLKGQELGSTWVVWHSGIRERSSLRREGKWFRLRIILALHHNCLSHIFASFGYEKAKIE